MGSERMRDPPCGLCVWEVYGAGIVCWWEAKFTEPANMDQRGNRWLVGAGRVGLLADLVILECPLGLVLIAHEILLDCNIATLETV
ncbi:putative phytoene dehydrogenase [Corchorus olitorius]|uniref:Phytoene dehydrogenase n=1 Tax=Corchorus olitorius TaxID=93759 RepID=A0A1R3GXG7_9ROSI|nr:putative phytoene dehydrogenase [Corchorus olitorius]